MALVQLTLETVKQLDYGTAYEAFQTALERAVRDCIDRPGDDRARKVIFQFTLKPNSEVHGNTISCEGAKGTFQIRCKLPDWETGTVDFGVKKNGIIYFSEESPEDHRQQTIFDGSEE